MQRLRVGDLVQVIAGKDKGKRGKISKIVKGRERVVVEGVNMVMRHVKPNQRNTEGGRIQMEAAIHASNVMLIDAHTLRVLDKESQFFEQHRDRVDPVELQ